MSLSSRDKMTGEESMPMMPSKLTELVFSFILGLFVCFSSLH